MQQYKKNTRPENRAGQHKRQMRDLRKEEEEEEGYEADPILYIRSTARPIIRGKLKSACLLTEPGTTGGGSSQRQGSLCRAF